MTKRRRFQSKEAEIEALRQEPEFQALVKDLRSQSPKQLDRLGKKLRQNHDKDITTRILELSKDGLTDAQIAARLAAEGIRNNKNEPFTANTIRSRRKRVKKKERRLESDMSDSSERTDATSLPSEISEESDIVLAKSIPSDLSEQSDTIPLDVSDETDMSEITEQPLPEQWKRQILQIVQTELRHIMQETQPFQTIQTGQTPQTILDESMSHPLPPEPAKIQGERGKKIAAGKRVKIAGTCDVQLYERLEQWRRARGITFSRALDAALWHFLGQPELSFQMESDKSKKIETSDND